MPPRMLVVTESGTAEHCPAPEGMSIRAVKLADAPDALASPGFTAVLLADPSGRPDTSLIARLHAHASDLPLIVASAGFASSALRAACLAAGAAAVIPLPYEREELTQQVARLSAPRADGAARRAAEERLRLNESTLRSFYESSSLLMGIVELADDDADIHHIYDSPSTDRFFGNPPGASANGSARALGVPAEVIALWVRHYRESERSGEPVEFEYRHVAEGTERWLSVSVSFIGRLEGGRSRFSYVAQDTTLQRRAAQEIAESEKRYRHLFEANPQPMWIFDEETLRFLTVNAAAVAHYGYSVPEFLALTIADIRPPEDVALLHAFLGKARPVHPTKDGSWRHIKKDGTVIEVDITSHSLSFEGRNARWVMVQDVTERNRTLRMLHESEERLESALHAGGLGVFDYDPQTGAVTCDARLREIWGLEADAPVTLDVLMSAVHPAERDSVSAALARTLDPRQRADYAVEYRVINRKDGAERWVHAEGDATFRDGAPVRLVGTTQDITARKHAEEALKEQQRLYRSITDNASLGLFIMDERQQCVFMNPAAEALTGFSLDELRGQPLHDYIHHTRPDGSHYPLNECPIDQAFPKNDRESGEEVFVHRDGRFYDVRFTASPIRDGSGRPTGTVIEVEDITERKRAERQIRLLMREVNHRSKNMLAVVQAMASQSALRGDPQNFAASFTERLHALAASHDLLVNNNWRGVGLGELVASQLSPFGGVMLKRIHFGGPSVQLTPAAAQAIGMALHELATNAAKYGALSTDGGAVALDWSISPKGDSFTMRWAESGGPPVSAPARKGFGSRLISEMTQLSIGGKVKLDYAPQGVVWELSAPLDKLAGGGAVL